MIEDTAPQPDVAIPGVSVMAWFHPSALVRLLVTSVQALTAVLVLIAVALNFANIVGRYVF